MLDKLKIGILGCGAVAYRWYLNGLCGEKKDYSVEVVCDINQARAESTAKKFNIPNYCSSIEELITFNVDLIVILTRHDDHYEHIKRCLGEGFHVYSEKPFAESVKQGQELIELAELNNLVLGSAPQVMLSSRNKKVKELIDNNLLGKITFIRASCSNLGPAGRADTDYDPTWFYNEGGSMASLGIYGLSTLLWLMGAPKNIAAVESISMPERTVMFGPAQGKKIQVTAPDNVACLFDYGQGTIALFDGSYSVATPPKYDFEIHGEKGSLLIGGFGGPSSVLFKPLNGELTELGPDDNCHLDWNLAWGVEETVSAVINGRETITSAKFALQTIGIMEKIKASSKQQKFIQV